MGLNGLSVLMCR